MKEGLHHTPVFITGMTRSGTTLLRLMCNQHPLLACPPESKFMLSLRRKYARKKLKVTDVSGIVAHLQQDRKISSRWDLNYQRLSLELEDCIRKGGDFAAVCLCIYKHRFAGTEKADGLIMDKNPGYALETEWLHELFPQSRFIHLVRDYRDCIASNNRSFKKRAVSVQALAWIRHNKQSEKTRQKAPHLFFVLRYEDLVSNPEKYLRELCLFLDIPFDAGMLEFYKNSPAKKTDLSKPVHTGNIGKYRSFLTPGQISLVDWICAAEGKRYGYTPGTAPEKLWFYPLVLGYAKTRWAFNRLLEKTYYASPLFVKKIAGKISEWLYRRFNFTTSRNHSEMKFNDRKKQQRSENR